MRLFFANYSVGFSLATLVISASVGGFSIHSSFADPAPTEILVTKFSGHIDDSSIMSFYEKMDATGYRANPVKWSGRDSMVFNCREAFQVLDAFPGARTDLFQAQQLKALNKYLETGYLTVKEAGEYLAHSVDFRNRPITFLHALGGDAEMARLNVLAPDAEIHIAFDGSERPRTIDSSLYIVPGQYLSRSADYELKDVAAPLPWQKDPAFASVSEAYLKRTRYKLFWELGRATGDKGRDFIMLLQMAGRDIVQQVLHIGMPNPENLKEAAITLHALNQENLEKFSKFFPPADFPNVEILRSIDNPQNAVLVIPLLDYLKRFAPGAPLQEYRSFKAHAPQATDGQIYSTLALFKFANYRLLDFRYRGKIEKSPIVVSTVHSKNFSMIETGEIARAFGIDAAAYPKIKAELSGKIMAETEKPWANLIHEPSHSPSLSTMGRLSNAIQISNFDPAQVKRDPMYVLSVVSAALDDFIRTASGGGGANPQQTQNFFQQMISNRIEFVLTTEFDSTAEAIKLLKPIHSFEVDLSLDSSRRMFWQEMRDRHHAGPFPARPRLQGFVFSAAQIYQLRVYLDQYVRSTRSPLPEATPFGFFWNLMGTSTP